MRISSRTSGRGTALEPTLRWLADGATTLAEAVSRIRAYAEYLDQLEGMGWQLTSEVDNLYLFLQKPCSPDW